MIIRLLDFTKINYKKDSRVYYEIIDEQTNFVRK